MTLFFNSSMPRSGSTLLQNILGNNPSFYCSPTSGLFDLLNTSRKTYTVSSVFKAQDEKTMKTAFLSYCRYAIQGFYEGITDAEYVVDKSRVWMVNYSFIDSFYPNPKIICMVRNLPDVLASMEQNYRKHPDKWDKIYEQSIVSVQDRINFWTMYNEKPVGDTLHRLKETIDRGFADKILFVRFEDLCRIPNQVMKLIHEFLDIPDYKYDFNNIKQVTHEDDKWHGKYGDHKISPILKPVKSKALELIGKDSIDYLHQNFKWYFDYFDYKIQP
jgi:sulfotransferase